MARGGVRPNSGAKVKYESKMQRTIRVTDNEEKLIKFLREYKFDVEEIYKNLSKNILI